MADCVRDRKILKGPSQVPQPLATGSKWERSQPGTPNCKMAPLSQNARFMWEPVKVWRREDAVTLRTRWACQAPNQHEKQKYQYTKKEPWTKQCQQNKNIWKKRKKLEQISQSVKWSKKFDWRTWSPLGGAANPHRAGCRSPWTAASACPQGAPPLQPLTSHLHPSLLLPQCERTTFKFYSWF